MFWKNNKIKENIMIFLIQNYSPNINYIENNTFFLEELCFYKRYHFYEKLLYESNDIKENPMIF